MKGLKTLKLELLSPLYYREAADLVPFTYRDGEAEQLFSFAIDPVLARSIEPDPRHFLGDILLRAYAPLPPAPDPVFPGRPDAGETGRGERAVLPAGKYLFAQVREILDREAFIDMAIEVQKDGLWERFNPDSRLYLRYLREEGGPVTQVLRPLPGG
ncbi:MAG: hypothetical protein LBQ38_04795 [Spirochaetaceae bacterium]|jgi:hypothetical protein|nr:hypothetical protein [Spirochaetaceae bacterium]